MGEAGVESEPVTTAEVVEGLRRERARLLDAVDAMGAGATTVSVTEPGGWTAKDVLGHMIHFAGQLAFGLGAPETPPPYVLAAAGESGGPISGEEWNRRAVAYWRPAELAAVRGEFERVTDVLIEHAGRRTDEEMNAAAPVPWAGGAVLWRFIGHDTYLSEWPAHTAQIEAAT
jgi:hypothetical protein